MPHVHYEGERAIEPYEGIVRVPPKSHRPREDMPVEYSKRPERWGWDSGPIASPVRTFTPPSFTDRPTDLFVPQSCLMHRPRFVRRSNSQEILIYTAGACSSSGVSPDARAGCGFVFHPTIPSANPSFRLELQGPDKSFHPQTSNRAELRAALAALQYRAWYGEGFTRVVIATNSEYTVLGVTEQMEDWIRNGWRTASGRPVVNRDLWQVLRDNVQRLEEEGVQPQFWLIHREWNGPADRLAKAAAAVLEGQTEYSMKVGVLV